MPSLTRLKKQYTGGQLRKLQSDLIMEATWDEDIATRTVYLYDWYHDTEPTRLIDLHPENDINKIPMSIKYVIVSSQTYAKDQVTYHLQMKPSQEMCVPYYNEMFRDRYDAEFPIGLYVDIPDSKGIFNRWLIVERANVNDPQFPTYEILKCDHVFQYMMDGFKTQIAGVLRSQNS